MSTPWREGMGDFNQLNLILSDKRRLASPNERRYITRQDIGHQRKLVVGAIYTSKTHNTVLNLEHGNRPFIAALQQCIDDHPLLSAVILQGDTESPEFAMLKTLDLNLHLETRVAPEVSENERIEKLLAQISDEHFPSPHIIPPWKVVLVLLQHGKDCDTSRLLVLFTNYHSHGDGRSCLAFHKSFHAGLSNYLTQANKSQSPVESTYRSPSTPLLPPIEEGGNLTLSWSYLLTPLLGTYLPSSIVSFLGLRDTWLSSEANIWRGKDTTFDPTNHSTGLVLTNIDSETFSRVLKHCKARKTTFTGLLKHLIARSLSALDGGAISPRVFNTGVAIDMRHLYQGRYSSASMMNCVTGHSEMIQYDHSQEGNNWATNPTSQFWEGARKTTASLKIAASSLHNQPIGLLQYLKSFRPWTAGLIGRERDMSFEISNLGAFSLVLLNGDSKADVAIDNMVFSQPANAAGPLVNFNSVSVKGRSLTITVTWQLGVLGLSESIEETTFIRDVCTKLESSMREIAAVPL